MLDSTFGEFLRRHRLNASITLLELSSKLGCSKVYLHDIELGNRLPFNSISTLELISNTLNLTYEERNQMYDLAALARNNVSLDLIQYIMNTPGLTNFLRYARDNPSQVDWSYITSCLKK